MRYLRHTETGAVTAVSEDDDTTFYRLVGERKDGRPVYEQTGAHDPAVKVEVKNEDTAKLEKETGAELVTPVNDDAKTSSAKPAAKTPAKSSGS